MATNASSSTSQTDSAGRDSRWIALYILCTGMLMIVLDSSIVNVALPSIQDDLGFSTSNLAWVVNAYLLTFGGLLLLAGRLGDLLGRRRIFLAGLVVFTVASALCGLATSEGMLIGARMLQGIGGALTAAVILGMIVTMFPEPREQAKALGVFAFVASGGASLGLLLGGVLTDALSWHWIFLVNVPIGAVTFFLAQRFVADEPGLGLSRGADVLGATLITSGLMVGVYAIVKVSDEGWGSLHTLGLGAVSIALLSLFVLRQARAANPLMRLGIFRSRNLSATNAVQILIMGGLFAVFFLGTLYLERVLGFEPIEIGLAFLPVSLGIGLLSLGFAERLSVRFGPKNTLLAGLTLAALGLLLFTQVPTDGSYVSDVLPSMVLIGVGMGTAFPAMMALAMSGVAPQDAGLASGLVNTTQQIGAALGLSLLATFSTTRSESLLGKGEPVADALTGGYTLAFGIATGLLVAAVVIVALVIEKPAAREPVHVEQDEQALAYAEA